MIDNLDRSFNSQNYRSPFYKYLMIDAQKQVKTYHSMGSLSARIIVLCFSSFYFGYNLTNLSTLSTQYVQTIWGEEAAQTTANAVIIGILPVGGFVGAGVAPLIMKYFSRKWFVLFINLLALIVQGILQINNMYVLLVCRGFQGIFVGCYMAITPIYINQIAPKQIIGSFGVFTQLFMITGVCFSYALGLLLIKTNASPFVFFRIMVSANVIFIVVQSILLLVNYIPESPCSLIRKNQNQKAKEVIAMFVKQQYVETTFNEKYLEVQPEETEQSAQIEQGNSNVKEKIVYSMRAFILGFELPFMQQLTGTNSIVTQANSIVSVVIPTLSEYVSIIINFVMFLGVLSAIGLLSNFGRKCNTLFGNLSLGIINIIIAILFVFDDCPPSGYIIFGLLIVYNFIYGASLGPVVWLYVPQIIPAKIVPFATMTNWFGASLCVIVAPIVINLNHKNPYPVFFFFGAVTLAFFVMNVFLMVQTKGKTTVEIAKSCEIGDEAPEKGSLI